MNLPKIFVINLKSSIDRKKHMKQLLSELPINVEWIEAIDVKDFSDEEIFQNYDDETCKKNIGNSLSKSEIGCALSHIKTWRWLQKQNLQDALIIEDDIIIKNQEAFLEILKKRNSFPKDWELILFAHGMSRIFKKGNESSFFHRTKIYKHYEVVRFTEKANCAQGYLINQKGIKKLLETVFPLQGPIDDYYTGNDKVVNLYGIEPVIIEEHFFYGKESNIEKERFTFRKDQQISLVDQWISKLKKALELMKIYKIAKQILRFKRSCLLKKYK